MQIGILQARTNQRAREDRRCQLWLKARRFARENGGSMTGYVILRQGTPVGLAADLSGPEAWEGRDIALALGTGACSRLLEGPDGRKRFARIRGRV